MTRPLNPALCWLTDVLFSWITPSIFQAQNGSVVDEWILCRIVPNAVEILQQHWSTWATLADFQKIAAAGFNTVRIPVGCKTSFHLSLQDSSDLTQPDWAFMLVPGEPYIQGHKHTWIKRSAGQTKPDLKYGSICTVLQARKTATTTPATGSRNLVGSLVTPFSRLCRSSK